MVAIFVALMFLGFVLTDLLVQRIAARRSEGALAVGGAVSPGLARELSWAATRWELPEGVYVAEGHSWLRHEAKGEIALGADEIVGYALGNVSDVILPRVGARVNRGDPLFHLALKGGVVTVVSPVEGKVSAVNHLLNNQPGLVTEQPYGKGWVCSVIPLRPKEALATMLSGSRAAAWLDREFRRFCDFISGQPTFDLALGPTSLDGGLAAPGCLALLGPAARIAFENQFLRS